jgi:hypothetical protein
MFLPLVTSLVSSGESQFGLLRYYLERHIALDGGHHGQLARRMMERLCGEDPRKWEEAAAAASAAIEERIHFWDAIPEALSNQGMEEVSRSGSGKNKQKRIKAGSGEKMNKVGSKAAPSAADFRKAAKTAKPVKK